MERKLTAITAAIGANTLFTLSHGIVHGVLPIPNVAWHAVYASVVIVAAPLAGLGLARRGRLRIGAAVVLLTALAGLAFELPWHFVVDNHDHVGNVTVGRRPFAVTTVLTTAGDGLAAAVGGWAWWHTRE